MHRKSILSIAGFFSWPLGFYVGGNYRHEEGTSKHSREKAKEKMYRNKTSKDNKTSSSQPKRDCTNGEHEQRVHYAIISSDIAVNNATKSSRSKEMTKARLDEASLDGEGRTNNARTNQTAFGRIKRKLMSKRKLKSCEEDRSTVDSMNEQSDKNTSRYSSNRIKQEHVYEVPSFSHSDTNEDYNSEEDEHIYANDEVCAENDRYVQDNRVLVRDETESNDYDVKDEAGAAGRQNRANCSLPKFEMANNFSDGGSREERWRQGKSMSLPVSRAKPPVPEKPTRRHASGKFNQSQSYDNLGNGGGNNDTAEPLQDSKPVSNGSYRQMLRTRSLPAPVKLDYTHQFLSGLNDLCKRGWYWGPLNSKEAEVMLRGKPDGTFLVRDSNDNRYLLSLSFRSEARTLHTRIEFCKGKFSFYAAPFITSGSHVSIVDLIEDCVEKSKEKVFCYSKGRGNNGAAFPVRLLKPISRFEQVCTLQHLCRFVIRQHFTLENISEMPLPGMMKRYLNRNHFDTTKQG